MNKTDTQMQLVELLISPPGVISSPNMTQHSLSLRRTSSFTMRLAQLLRSPPWPLTRCLKTSTASLMTTARVKMRLLCWPLATGEACCLLSMPSRFTETTSIWRYMKYLHFFESFWVSHLGLWLGNWCGTESLLENLGYRNFCLKHRSHFVSVSRIR